jgi:hypothetical protein
MMVCTRPHAAEDESTTVRRLDLVRWEWDFDASGDVMGTGLELQG